MKHIINFISAIKSIVEYVRMEEYPYGKSQGNI